MEQQTTDGRKPLLSIRYVARLLGYSPEGLLELADRAPHMYAPFDKRVVRNGKTKLRHIDNPTGELKFVQHRIKERLLDTAPLPSFILGGVRGKTIRANARIHVAQPVVVTLDIASYFPSVSHHRVFRVWRQVFGASEAVACALTKLTTFSGYLPQGSPASTPLANLVMLPLAQELSAFCASEGLRLSVWVDDITVSGAAARQALPEILRRIHAYGLKVSSRKVKVMSAQTRQFVTGTVVNRKVSAGQARMRSVRASLARWKHRGRDPSEVARLRGAIGFIGSVCKGQGSSLKGKLAADLRGPSVPDAADVDSTAARSQEPKLQKPMSADAGSCPTTTEARADA